MPVCSIIILNYQGEKLIERTVQSLINLDYPKDSYEIIVVDNASTDGSMDILKKIQGIRTIYSNRNLGFAGGNNLGIKVAKGEYIVLLNNDCTVDKHWLKELVALAEKDEKTAAVGSKTYLKDTNKIQNAGIVMFADGYGRDRGAIVLNHKQNYKEDKGQYDNEEEVYAACGVAVLYRRSVLEKVGLLDESFFLYYEDVEVSERLRMNGYRVMYAPKAIVHHHHAASSGEWSPFFIYHSELGRLLHMFFWFPQRIFWREYITFTAKAKARVLYGLKNNKLRQQIQYIRASWNIVTRLPKLYAIRRKKHKGIIKDVIEQNYQLIKNNKRD